MATSQVIQRAAGVSGVLPVDLKKYARGVGIILTINGSLTCTLQFTGDNIQKDGYTPGSGNWNNHETLANLTASTSALMLLPVVAVRLNVTAFTNGSVTLSVVQAEG
jgi:hypothetical protein